MWYENGAEWSGDAPRYFIETILPNLPIQVASNSFDHVIDASRIIVEKLQALAQAQGR